MKYFLFVLIFLPLSALAAEPVWLLQVPIAGNQTGFSGYINFLYLTTISLAALLAVIKIIIAGVKYMLTDIVTSKSDAIKDIRGSLFGLLIILGAFLVLNTINPNLTNSSVSFTNLEEPDFKLDPPPVIPSEGDTARAKLIEDALPPPDSVPPATGSSTTPVKNPFVGMVPIIVRQTATEVVYVFDSSSYRNTRTIQFQRETQFKLKCKDAKGVYVVFGAEIFKCTIKK